MLRDFFRFKHKPLIVIVEDDDSISTLLATFLTGKGFEVKQAKNGIDGLDMIQKTRPALVLLDIMMPGMSGKDVLLNLKSQEETKEIPVIMCTSLNEIDDVERCCNWGANGYVVKPFNLSRVLDKIKSTLHLDLDNPTPPKNA